MRVNESQTVKSAREQVEFIFDNLNFLKHLLSSKNWKKSS